MQTSSMQMEMTSIQQGPAGPPKFTKVLKNIETMEGQNVHLEARLSPTGDSTMKVEWTVNGKPLKTGNLFFLSFCNNFPKKRLLKAGAKVISVLVQYFVQKIKKLFGLFILYFL